MRLLDLVHQGENTMHISQFAHKLRCEHCGETHGASKWPLNGDQTPFYYQAEPGTYQVSVLCPRCNKEWYVVWDQDPGAVMPLHHPAGVANNNEISSSVEPHNATNGVHDTWAEAFDRISRIVSSIEEQIAHFPDDVCRSLISYQCSLTTSLIDMCLAARRASVDGPDPQRTLLAATQHYEELIKNLRLLPEYSPRRYREVEAMCTALTRIRKAIQDGSPLPTDKELGLIKRRSTCFIAVSILIFMAIVVGGWISWQAYLEDRDKLVPVQAPAEWEEKRLQDRWEAMYDEATASTDNTTTKGE